MNWINALVGGAIGALLGSIAWIAVGYFTGYELGILAVGVGIASGIGVAIGAQGKAGVPGGVLAAICAMVAIVAARYVLVQFEIDNMIRQAAAGEYGGDIPGPEDGEYWTSFIADRIMEDRAESGYEYDWEDETIDFEDDELYNDYPSDVWAEARAQWNDVPVSERAEFCKAATELMASESAQGIEDFRTAFSIIGVLFANLHPMSLVIMGIAMVGAFKIARDSKPAGGDEPTTFEIPQPTGLPGMPAATMGSLTGVMARPLPGDPLERPGMSPTMSPTGGVPRRAPSAPSARPDDSAPLGLPGMPPPGTGFTSHDRDSR